MKDPGASAIRERLLVQFHIAAQDDRRQPVTVFKRPVRELRAGSTEECSQIFAVAEGRPLDDGRWFHKETLQILAVGKTVPFKDGALRDEYSFWEFGIFKGTNPDCDAGRQIKSFRDLAVLKRPAAHIDSLRDSQAGHFIIGKRFTADNSDPFSAQF